MSRIVRHDIDTPRGLARAHVHRAASPFATLVLGHGAGGGVDARDLAALAERLPARGVTVVLVEQPWRVSGRRVAGPPAHLDLAWRWVLAARPVASLTRERLLVVGGRSAGARVACRNASDVGADAVLAMAFPLHPPGRPERSRVDELLAVRVPLLVVQGARDAFGSAEEFPAEVEVDEVPFADHAFAVPKRAPTTQADALDALSGAALAFVGKNFAVGLIEEV